MRSVVDLARLERLEFADLLDGLSPQQWGMSSLCDGWTVWEVAAHTIAYLGQSRAHLVSNMIRTRCNLDLLNTRGLSDHAGRCPDQVARLMRSAAAPSGAGALFGGRVTLIECLIHQQDIRRPLGIPRWIPEERLRVALDYARISPVIGGARRTRRLRLTATDMDWSAGRGHDVRGTGEALLLAMMGRSSTVLAELDGAGVELLP